VWDLRRKRRRLCQRFFTTKSVAWVWDFRSAVRSSKPTAAGWDHGKLPTVPLPVRLPVNTEHSVVRLLLTPIIRKQRRCLTIDANAPARKSTRQFRSFGRPLGKPLLNLKYATSDLDHALQTRNDRIGKPCNFTSGYQVQAKTKPDVCSCFIRSVESASDGVAFVFSFMPEPGILDRTIFSPLPRNNRFSPASGRRKFDGVSDELATARSAVPVTMSLVGRRVDQEIITLSSAIGRTCRPLCVLDPLADFAKAANRWLYSSVFRKSQIA